LVQRPVRNGLHRQPGSLPGKLPIIGFLGPGTASVWSSWTAAFDQRLRELGWSHGRTVAIEYRWGEGRPERFAEIAAEFVRLKVDIIVTGGSAVPALKQAFIPIVFAIAGDPVAAALSQACRDRAVTSLDSRTSNPISPPSGSNCCERSSPICVGWRF
jgi:hypothetical protein